MDELAPRGRRLGAAVIDGLLFAVPYGMVKASSAPFLVIVGFLIFLALFGYQCWLVAKQGQTIGKRYLGIRIVGVENGENPGFVRAVLLRTMVNGLIALIPFYGLVDILFIFRGDRRCIHDWMARTKVVPADAAPAPVEAQPM